MSSKLTAGDLQVVSRIAVFRGLKAETVEQIIAPATAMMLRLAGALATAGWAGVSIRRGWVMTNLSAKAIARGRLV